MLKSTKTSGRKALSPDELEVHYRGVYFTTVALALTDPRGGAVIRPLRLPGTPLDTMRTR